MKGKVSLLTTILNLLTLLQLSTTTCSLVSSERSWASRRSRRVNAWNHLHKPSSSSSSQRRALLLFQKSKKNNVKGDEENGNGDGNGEEEAEDDRWQDSNFVRRNRHWVVLVDDEESIRMAVGDYLYDSGYQVTACADAPAFQELIRNKEKTNSNSNPRLPDAVVSDIRMPGMDGIELLQWIRKDERLQHLPVILLTAKGLTEDRIQGYRAGADAYLAKPFAPDELLGMLDNAIARRKQMKGESSGSGGGTSLFDLQQQIAEIKQVVKRNTANTVQKTNVYLTPAQREVLELLSKGYTNGEIASERGVAMDRVVRTIQKLYAETGTKTRTELLRWAIQTGYVPKR